MSGQVFLVGAGPGDPGLLTLKACEKIREADLVIYDYLANPEHLRHAKPSAARICVGKRFRHQLYSQKKIQQMILRAARKGQNVVRLKGGDPYLFGRGGEEALFLKKHRIPFEVVPGVTSATACAAYAGIPLTHREHNASVTFLTGHRAHDEKLDSVPWREIAALKGTIVIYMGFYNLAVIARQLRRVGMRPDTRICVIEWGTLPRQRSADGTLADIAAKVKRAGLRAPAIIIIGDVVSLRKELAWYEKLPLFGKKIVITRTRDKAGALADKLHKLGAETLEFPTIEIAPPDFREMDEAIENLSRFDWLVFTSTYGADFFFARLRGLGHDARRLQGLRIACVGPGTGEALKVNGIVPDLMPERFETAAIAEAFKKNKIPLHSKEVLLLRTSIAPPALEKDLRALGAVVTRATAYQTRRPQAVPQPVKEALLGGKADFVTFTSSSTVEHFVKMLGLKNMKRISRKTCFASIGPVTSRALKTHRLKPACQAKRFTVDGLVEAICRAAGKAS